MRHVSFSLSLLMAIAGFLQAQPSHGYIYFAPGQVHCCGASAMTLQFGVGGEAVLWKGLGLGAEVAAVGVRQDFGDSVLGVFSPNGYYHFIHGKDLKLDPFVTGGYTLMFRSGSESLFNFGAGANYWFHHHLGARLEFRDQVYTKFDTLHYWGVRFGLAFH
jgi:hypothetical protein